MTYTEDIQRIESQHLRLILNKQADTIDELRIEVLLAKIEVLEQKVEQDIINNKLN